MHIVINCYARNYLKTKESTLFATKSKNAISLNDFELRTKNYYEKLLSAAQTK